MIILFSFAPSCSVSFLSSVQSSLSLVFHPFSRQSDRVCPTGQPFSTHHAHHFLSSFPLVSFFHLPWPVPTFHKTLYLCFHMCLCPSVVYIYALYAYHIEPILFLCLEAKMIYVDAACHPVLIPTKIMEYVMFT